MRKKRSFPDGVANGEGAPYSSTIAANMSSARAATALWRRRSMTPADNDQRELRWAATLKITFRRLTEKLESSLERHTA